MKLYSLKDNLDPNDIAKLHINMFIMFSDFVKYCWDNHLFCLCTSLREDVPGRVSNTHKEGRAVDFSIYSWTEDEISKCELWFNEKFKNVAAISLETGLPVACKVHKVKDGVRHIHLQVAKI